MSKGRKFICIVIALVVLVGCGLFLYFTRKEDDKGGKDNTNNLASQYVISYHSNIPNEVDSVKKQGVENGKPYETKSVDTFVYDGYHLTAWNTNSDGSGTTIGLSESKMCDYEKDIDLYGVWASNDVIFSVKIDNEQAINNQITVIVELRGDDTLQKTSSNGTINFSKVPNGTYNVFSTKKKNIYGAFADTGIDIVISNNSVSDVINYYTFDVETSEGITNTSSESSTYLKGVSLEISCEPDSTYTWSSWLISNDSITPENFDAETCDAQNIILTGKIKMRTA